MDKKFREYHQFSDEEFKKLWQECIFVFDTNVLLNMYRYSRKTVDAYIKVLKDLKEKGQLWIPYQVGYEFYENRVDVIQEFEKSYDEILILLDKVKADVETKYKNHPFLDLEEIKVEIAKGLTKAETKIKDAKKKHPEWLKKDDVLSELDKVFEDCIGDAYDEARMDEIKLEGKKRYDTKIPPGYQDAKKPEDRRYGDLILWLQIIDHVKTLKKPVILITGDVKEDWWLKKEGSRIMPLPQLKKELLDEAAVEFHIYTADRFLELYESGEKRSDSHDDAVKEVRKIRELEEASRMARRIESSDFDILIDNNVGDFYAARIYAFELLRKIMILLREKEIRPSALKQLEFLYRRIRVIRNSAAHGYYEEQSSPHLASYLEEMLYLLQETVRLENFSKESFVELTELIDRLELFVRKSKENL
jgi:hypothetical protein